MPPDVREWLPDNHLAWFVIDAVAVMDLEAFYGAYRADGHGRPAYEPSMMVALLLYGWSRGVRSSRAIERACIEDVAFRVIAAQQRPDHATITARFAGLMASSAGTGHGASQPRQGNAPLPRSRWRARRRTSHRRTHARRLPTVPAHVRRRPRGARCAVWRTACPGRSRARRNSADRPRQPGPR